MPAYSGSISSSSGSSSGGSSLTSTNYQGVVPVLVGDLGVFGSGRIQVFQSSGTFIVPNGVKELRVRCLGAGGGGGASSNTSATSGNAGGSTSFGSLLSATGGSGGAARSGSGYSTTDQGGAGGIGGSGIGGDYQAAGGTGGKAYYLISGGGGGAGSQLGPGGNGGYIPVITWANGLVNAYTGGAGGAIRNSALVPDVGNYTITGYPAPSAFSAGGAVGSGTIGLVYAPGPFGLVNKSDNLSAGNASGIFQPFPFSVFTGAGGVNSPTVSNGSLGGPGGSGAGGAGGLYQAGSNNYTGVGGDGGVGGGGGGFYYTYKGTTAVYAAGGGGGGGGFSYGAFMVSPGSSYAVTVGKGGSGGFGSGFGNGGRGGDGLVIVEY